MDAIEESSEDAQALRRHSGGQLHHQLASVVRDGIAQGRYQPGQALPAEMELCSLFSVSRITVRRAMQSLVEEGLVDRHRGRGTFVRGPSTTTLDLTSPRSYFGSSADLAARSTPVVRFFDFVEAQDEVPEALGVKRGARVLRVDRMRYSEQTPVFFSSVYFPGDLGVKFSKADFETTSLANLMSRARQKYGRVELRCSAMLADPVTAKAFDVLIGAPLVELRRVSCNPAGRAIEYLHAMAPPDRYQVRVSFEPEPGNRLDE